MPVPLSFISYHLVSARTLLALSDATSSDWLTSLWRSLLACVSALGRSRGVWFGLRLGFRLYHEASLYLIVEKVRRVLEICSFDMLARFEILSCNLMSLV